MINLKDFPEYYQRYVEQLQDINHLTDVNEALALTFQETMDVFAEIHPEHIGYRYQEGKWTMGEVFGHLIDTERVFAYRAMRIARGDKENQPGFDQDEFVLNSNYEQRDYESIKNELLAVEETTGYLFEHMSEEALKTVGKANDLPFTPEQIGFITAAHRLHHINVLRERYLSD